MYVLHMYIFMSVGCTPVNENQNKFNNILLQNNIEV